MALGSQERKGMGRLAQLAASTGSPDRNGIYLAVASLYRSQDMQLSEREGALMGDILRRLARGVDIEVRLALSEELVRDPEAPLGLIRVLVGDTIEVARPLILGSSRLDDARILSLLPEADMLHQAACATRPYIGEVVCEVLAKSEAEPVLVALLRNVTAKIGPATFRMLVEKSRHIAAIRNPLLARADLPASVAAELSDNAPGILPNTSGPALAESSACRLVDKLAAAGQLRTGFLLRVLNQGQLDQFDAGFAKLIDLDLPAFRDVFYRGGPRAVALACRAAGIDRAVFPTVFNLSRQSRGLSNSVTSQERSEIDRIFGTVSRAEAADRLHGPRAA